MAFKLITAAQHRWRAVNGKLVERSDDQQTAAPTANAA
jgi:hypothetical protein